MYSQHIDWSEIPALRVLLLIGAGISLEVYLHGSQYIQALLIALSVCSIAAIALMAWVARQQQVTQLYRWRYAVGMAVQVLLLSVGYLLSYSYQAPNRSDYYGSIPTGTYTYMVHLIEPPAIRPKSISLLCAVDQVFTSHTQRPTSGYLAVYMPPSETASKLSYGDQLLIHASPKPYDAPRNPGQFDYAAYQALHGIHYEVYLHASQWRPTGIHVGNTLLMYIYRLRSYLLELLLHAVHSPDERAVATSLMLGYRSYMLPEIMAAYRGSGVLHVLSVSGLHVAVLYLLLLWLLQGMVSSRRAQVTQAIIIITILCIYALLTGSGAPVWRSVLMCSMLAIARISDSYVHPIQVLSVTALVLLLFDPLLVADVGFELSYLAVGSMIYFYPRIYRSIECDHVLVDKSWQLACGSISAQILTLPLSIYYFHTIPNYAIPANMIIVPLSEVSMLAGLAVFVTGFSATLVHVTGWILERLLMITDWLAYYIEALPYATIGAIHITTVEVIILYVLIVCITWYMMRRQATAALLALASVLLLCGCNSIRYMQRQDTARLIVYSVPHRQALAMIHQGKVYLQVDSALSHDQQSLDNLVLPSLSSCGIVLPTDTPAMSRYTLSWGACYLFQGKKIIHLNKRLHLTTPHKLTVDVVILSAECKSDMQQISSTVAAPVYVFDSSCPSWQRKQWATYCIAHGIIYHDCTDLAYVLDIHQ
jgi:competence protein ComEC